jgi:hypothetical protein
MKSKPDSFTAGMRAGQLMMLRRLSTRNNKQTTPSQNSSPTWAELEWHSSMTEEIIVSEEPNELSYDEWRQQEIDDEAFAKGAENQ